MKDKYSHAKREHYGRRLAAHLCDQHFGPQPTATLDGPAVLRFTPIRQVNLLVVQQLLAQWTAEMARLRSPYFDFEAPDVRQALTQFMNTLSRRIQLTRGAFEPLLARAVADTLGVVTDPVLTFEEKLLGDQPTATAAQLRDALRYLDLNKDLFGEFIDSLSPEAPLERDFLLERFRLHQEATYKGHQLMEKLVAEFSALLPLTEADLWADGPVRAPAIPIAETPRPVQPQPAPKPEPVQVPEPVRPSEPANAPEPVVAPVAVAPTPVPVQNAPQPSVAAPTFMPTPAFVPPPAPTPEPKPVHEPIVAPRRPITEAAPTSVPLYEKLKAERSATAPLSETLRPEKAGATLAEKPPKVESLREAISINQRFGFINELFNGENMEYHNAIQHLDTFNDPESAKRYVTQDLAAKYDWTRKEEHVGRLLKLIDRKFA
ncbi:hypothetical protein [Hymenobacter radiodurans]|uniref:hypothetical protein n=1 Tax=Hymenobacter radiodurans TaxID=2496028 RepID=UPI0010585441|nr:hypothetical protein [Hymenobacter radiodurans]